MTCTLGFPESFHATKAAQVTNYPIRFLNVRIVRTADKRACWDGMAVSNCAAQAGCGRKKQFRPGRRITRETIIGKRFQRAAVSFARPSATRGATAAAWAAARLAQRSPIGTGVRWKRPHLITGPHLSCL